MNRNDDILPIATYNWGCSSRCGEPQLKLMIQWLAASVALLPHILYFTAENSELNKVNLINRDINWVNPAFGSRGHFPLWLFSWTPSAGCFWIASGASANWYRPFLNIAKWQFSIPKTKIRSISSNKLLALMKKCSIWTNLVRTSNRWSDSGVHLRLGYLRLEVSSIRWKPGYSFFPIFPRSEDERNHVL